MLCVGRGEFATSRGCYCRPRVGGLQTAAAAPLHPSAHKTTHEILPAMPPTIAVRAAARPESPPCNASLAPLAAARCEGAMRKKKAAAPVRGVCVSARSPRAFPLAAVLGAVSSPILVSTASLSAAHRLPYRPQTPRFGAQSNPTAHGWARLGYAAAAAKPPLGLRPSAHLSTLRRTSRQDRERNDIICLMSSFVN